MGVEPKIGGKTPTWMVKLMENPIKMDDLGGFPLFLEPPILKHIVSKMYMNINDNVFEQTFYMQMLTYYRDHINTIFNYTVSYVSLCFIHVSLKKTKKSAPSNLPGFASR